MYLFMSCQIALLTECLTTHITGIKSLTTMYAFMSCQIAQLTECLITHITCIRTLTTMYAFMMSDCSVDRMTYYAYHSYKDAHHYVCVYELSDNSVD